MSGLKFVFLKTEFWNFRYAITVWYYEAEERARALKQYRGQFVFHVRIWCCFLTWNEILEVKRSQVYGPSTAAKHHSQSHNDYWKKSKNHLDSTIWEKSPSKLHIHCLTWMHQVVEVVNHWNEQLMLTQKLKKKTWEI